MNDESLPERLILASTSKYREMLLQRLDLAFDCISPGTDETALEGESPNVLVSRLASQKARAVASKFPTAAVIGSDQVAVLNGEILSIVDPCYVIWIAVYELYVSSPLKTVGIHRILYKLFLH